MDEKDRISGFKALVNSHKRNSYHLIETDGNFRLWQDLSPEGKVQSIAKDAAWYDVPFEEFAQVVRESVGKGEIEEAAMRLALRSERELNDLERLLPDDGLIDTPSLVERLRDILNVEDPGQETDAGLTGKEMRILLNELRADEAAGKREDAHWYGMEALRKSADAKTKAPATEIRNDRDIER